MHELVIVRDAVVQLVAVGHQHGAVLRTRIETLRVLRTASRRIREHSNGRFRAVDLRPQITLRLRSSSGLLQNLEGCLVAVDEFRLEQHIAHQADHWGYGQPDSYNACGQRI